MNRIKRVVTWLLAIFLALLCILAGNWQLSKGLKLHQRNSDITLKSELPPLINPTSFDTFRDQWRKFKLTGSFTSDFKFIKNQYLDGQYGFHILQNFNSQTLGVIKIDRGWVKAGANALTEPQVPKILPVTESVVVRLRSEFLNTHTSGTLFALPAGQSRGKEIYFDLVSSKSNPPLTILETPSLSTGPHFAYAFQWYLFSLFLILGRFIFGKRIKL